MRYPVLQFCLISLLAVTCVEREQSSRKEVSSLSLSQETAEMIVGETTALKLTILPSDAVYDGVTWASSRQYVASVSEDGVVTALAEGTSSITASAGGKYATCTVTVDNRQVAVSSVTLDKTTLSMTKGLSSTLKATVTPADATNGTVRWSSSDEEKVTVDNFGIVTAVGGGSAVITARAGNETANCLVSVNVPVESVRMEQSQLTVDVGAIITLEATVIPEDTTDNTVKWSSSNSTIISVDGYGNITAVKEGTAIITAKCGGKTASCTITAEIKAIPVVSLALDRREVSLETGQTTTLIANVSPADATDKTVYWTSSNPDLVSVTDDGYVIAKKLGNATITARAGPAADYCNVTVTSLVVPVTSVMLSTPTLALEKGQTATLVAAVMPENATNKTITWSSADATIVSVDDNGLVTALAGGTSAVTAAAGEKSNTCIVTVTVPVRSVTLERYNLSMTVGESASLTAKVNPSDATEKAIRWNSSDTSVAMVDDSGRISALKKGTASVTASCGGVSASCTVEVSNVPFTIDPESVYLTGRGGTFEVTASGSSSYSIQSKPAWVDLKGTEGRTHTFEVGINRETEERSGIILFCDDDGVSRPFAVKQAAGGPFAINPDKVLLGASGGTFEIKVSCPTDYHINALPEWIKDITDGTVLQLHQFQVSRNNGIEPREGVITFCDDQGTCLSCAVTQKHETEGATGDNEDVDDGQPVNW